MFGIGRRSRRTHPHTATTSTTRRRGFRFHRKDPNRRAAGYKAALHNPNTTHAGRERAKEELVVMGRANEAHGHPSLTSRIKHMLGIRWRPARRTHARY